MYHAVGKKKGVLRMKANQIFVFNYLYKWTARSPVQSTANEGYGGKLKRMHQLCVCVQLGF